VLASNSYGDPARERRRPGGSDLAEIGQGSQADLSLPSGCQGVSYSKARRLGPHRSSGSVRTNEMTRETARAVESATSPGPTKGPSVTKCVRRVWEPGAGGWRPGGSDSA